MEFRRRLASRRPARAFAVTVLSAAMIAATTAPLSARQTRNLAPTESDLWVTRGYSVHPCVPVVIETNVVKVAAEHRDLARGQVAQAVQIYNEILGRDLFRMGGDTTRSWTASDGHHVVELSAHGDPQGDFTSGRYASGRGRVVATGTVDGGTHITDFGILMDVELNPVGRVLSVDTLLHEIGHGLGFHHTIDGRSIMSYNFNRRPFYDDLHDERRFGPAYLKALRHLLPADCAYATLGQEHDWRRGGPVKQHAHSYLHVPWPTPALLDADVETVADVGRAMSMVPAEDFQESLAGRIVLCRQDLFADCLGGSALAGPDGAVMFVPGGPAGTMPPELLAHLDQRQDLELFLLGGPNAVSVEIEQALRDHAAERVDSGNQWSIERVAGADDTGRFGTAVAIADRMIADGATSELVLLARADNPVDAVAAGAIAARLGLPILLTPSHELHPVTSQWLASRRPARMVVLGGQVAVQQVVADAADVHVGQVERAWGANRRATTVAIAEHPWLWGRHTMTDSGAFVLVNGSIEESWALALAAAPFGARELAPILFTEYDHLGMTERGGQGAADPGWYFWNLDAEQPADTSSPETAPKLGLRVMGTVDGRFSHPFLADTAHLTANAELAYRSDGG